MIKALKTWMLKRMGLPTCQEIVEFAYGYLEGDLDSDLQAKFEWHLRGCGNCKRFVESYRQVARPERLLRKIDLPPDFERRIIDFLKESR